MHKLRSWVKTHPVIATISALVILLAVAVGIMESNAGSTSSVLKMNSASTQSIGAPGIALFMADGDEEAMAVAMDSTDRATRFSPMPPIEPTAGATAAEVEQRIIKNGSMRIVVESVDDAIADLTGYASSIGGYVENSSVTESKSGIKSGWLTFRMPVEAFEAAAGYVRDSAKRVREESLSGQDVTEQFTDLQAHLRNAESQEEAYLAILDRADTVEDILKVQVQLGNIRGQIESYEGRIKYLENRTSLSTLQVYLEEDVGIGVPTDKFELTVVFRQAVRALVQAFQGILTALIWTAIVGLGLLLPTLLVIWVLYRIVRRFWFKK